MQKTVKLKETLTTQQIIQLLNGRQLVGIFTSMIMPSDTFYSLAKELCSGYYLHRSGEKTISPTFEKILFYAEDEDVTQSAEYILGKLIRGKFIDKWNKIYNALIVEPYNVLADTEMSIKRTGNNTDTTNKNATNTKTGNNADAINYDTTRTVSGNNSDQNQYNSNLTDDETRSNKQTTIRNSNSNDSVYGFNSEFAVPTDENTDFVNETVEGKPSDNTRHNSQSKTGTDTRTISINESQKNNGTDTHSITINETENITGNDTTTKSINEDFSRSGRHASGAKLIDEEIELRNTKLFYDIIYADIDSIATLQIYI